jgi:arginyl-tRNA synthetase
MLKKSLEKLLKAALENIAPSDKTEVSLEQSHEQGFGDFSTSMALALSKALGKPPRIIAEEIIASLPTNDIIAKTEIAGPGFINIWLSDEAYHEAFQELNKNITQESFGRLKIGQAKTAITDTSHPNVAKPMGVHHLLSTIIGQAINNLLKTCGYTLIRDNYLGDWGTQFGKLTYAIKTWGDMNHIIANPIPELQKLYVKFHDEAERDPILEDRGREEFKKLEDNDPENRKLWNWIRDLSLVEFEKIYKRLGVEFDMIHGESYYEDKMPSVLEEGLKKKIIVEGEGGSLIIPMDDPNLPPCLLQKSDGATTYATRDIARIKDWEQVYHVDLPIVICDIAQKLHHDQINEAAQKLGFKKIETRVHFGRMSFPESAMSTRKGNIILLEEVLNEAEKLALEKIEEHKSELPEDEKRELARKMGIGAVKYNILSQNRNKNYTFDWDTMLSFEGNSAPYLQYAYTRTQSLIRKAEESLSFRPKPGTPGEVEKSLTGVRDSSAALGMTSEEKSLLKKLLDFESTIQVSLEQYKPNLLCTYLFELAQSFSHFYNNLRILDAEKVEERETRLALVSSTAYVLKHGLEILGIEVPAKM